MTRKIKRIMQGEAQKITAVLYHQGNMKRARGGERNIIMRRADTVAELRTEKQQTSRESRQRGLS